ncbi:MAG: TRAP transporter large permease subunit [Acidobacteriota bacterium]
MESAGFCMLGLVGVLLIGTGLPAFAVLIGVAVAFSVLGVVTGAVPLNLLSALPARLIGLLEYDLLQALPLYVLMGALLNRLPLADILFRAGNAAFARTRAAPLLSALGLGAMLAPMNGSVGASVATLSRILQPRLRSHDVAAADGLAVVCVASTFGVVVPPSLVLILLGDAMLRAHTEAVNATGQMVRIINTQDVFRGALVPAAIFLLLCLLLAWWTGRREPSRGSAPIAPVPLGWRNRLIALGTAGFIVLLLAAVVVGYVYAVEAAAAGTMTLLLAGLVTRTLTAEIMGRALRDTMAVTGALFALLLAATTFTLVVRAFGTDRVLAELVAAIPGGPVAVVLAGLLALGLCAFVLDAFEIIFVVIPLLMPPLLMRAPDAVWVAVLALLALQASFLVPPVGYAVMMARTAGGEGVALPPLIRALLPFLLAQMLVLGLTVAIPALTHVAAAKLESEGRAKPALSDEEVRKAFQKLASPPLPDEPPK